ncbi:MAG: dihydropteroate synthase, partial [Actinomycetota bacterium]
LRRVLPVIEGLVGRVDAPISIDTRKPAVALRAVDAGAVIVNDTAGEGVDAGIDVAAETGAAIVIMHSRGTPKTMRSLTDYDDIVSHVGTFLARRARDLEDAGVEHDAIVVDPGFGFAKDPGQNLTVLNRLEEIVALGYPVLVGTSRKSFIGEILDLPVEKRVEGTIATVLWAIAAGARIVRVHDVEPTMRAVRMAEAIRDAGP